MNSIPKISLRNIPIIKLYIIVQLVIPFLLIDKKNYFFQFNFYLPIIFDILLVYYLISRIQKTIKLSLIQFLLFVFVCIIFCNSLFHNILFINTIYIISIISKLLILLLITNINENQFEKEISSISQIFQVFAVIHILIAYLFLITEFNFVKNNLFVNYFLGIFDAPSRLTEFLILFIPPIFYLDQENGKFKKILIYSISLFILFISLYNFIRVSIIIFTIFFSIHIYKKLRPNLTIFCIITIAIFSLLILLKFPSTLGRFTIFEISLSIISKNFFAGIGINSFAAQYLKYQCEFNKSNPYSSGIYYMDNINIAYSEIIQILVEFGIFGFLVFISILFLLIKKIRINNYYSPSNFLLISIFILMLFSFPFHLNEIRNIIFLNLIIFNKKILYSIRPIFTIAKFHKFLIYPFTIFFLLFVFYIFSKNFEWSKEYLNFIKNKNSIDSKNYKILEYNPVYLVSMAQYYSKSKLPLTSIEWLKKYDKIETNYMTYIRMGDVFNSIDSNNLAITQYKFASCILPNRLTPKYKIMSTYWKLNDTINTKYWIDEVLTNKNKIISEKTSKMVEDARKIQDKLNYSK